MATHAKHTCSGQGSSFQATALPLKVPLSAFNKQLLDEARSISRASERSLPTPSHSTRHNTSRNSRRSKDYSNINTLKRHHSSGGHQRSSSMNTNLARHNLASEKPPRPRRSVSEQPSQATSYVRPTGPELVSSKVPSCIGLPPAWNYIHDRFIAYLATHAPLDRNGKVPIHEERRERWGTEDIVRLVGERFPRMGGNIKVSMIEKRLALLDLAGDNDYFKVPYGAYGYEEWGHGI